MQKQFYLVIVILSGLTLVTGCASTTDMAQAPAEQQAASEPEEVAAPEPAPAAEPEPEMPPATVFYFDYDDATLRPYAVEALEEHAERLKTNSDAIRIEGHADERGTETYNQQLGQRRADAVRDLLVSKGINANRIETVSYGEKSPDVTGYGEPVWQKNRRVVLK